MPEDDVFSWDKCGPDKLIARLWEGYGSIMRREYRHPTTAAAVKVIVKTVSPPRHVIARDSQSQSFARKMASYEVERYFYQWLATHGDAEDGGEQGSQHRPCRTARMHACGADFLALEDLCAAGFSRPVRAASAAHTRAVLGWLAEFHARFWGCRGTAAGPLRRTGDAAARGGVWDQGTYWHLATRQSEFGMLDARWQLIATKVDAYLSSLPDNCVTVVHGDMKAENCFVSDKSSGESAGLRVAVVDFQYVGYGCGAKDVVYFLTTSCDRLNDGVEAEYLTFYHAALLAALERRGKSIKYPRAAFLVHYEACMVDWLRFMKGWGLWGEHEFVARRVDAILDANPAWMR
ncbi:hypothetical protein HDU82_002713 [Entophlyctis luteolus]|nr:hypothetical protein HDU82_002713 [Entophlyctis luteolus]